MLGALARTKTSPVGIDLGTCSLRAVQLQDTGDGYRIHHWVNIEVEPTSPQPPAFDHDQEMKLAFGAGTIDGRRVCMALTPPDVEYRMLDVPTSLLDKTPAQLRHALQYELDKQLPWALNECEIAVWPIRETKAATTSTMIVATKTSSIEDRLQILTRNQLECLRADVVPNAMIQACSQIRSPQTSEDKSPLWAVLDIGFGSCRLYLIHNDRPVYARILPGSGCQITRALAESLHVDFRIAEQYKRLYGIQRTERGLRSVVGGLARLSENELPSVLYAICRPLIEHMTHEIERSCRFVMGQLPGVSLERIYLIGGGARLRGLAEALQAMTGLTISLPEPDAACLHSSEANQAACNPSNYVVLASCVGLARMGGHAT